MIPSLAALVPNKSLRVAIALPLIFATAEVGGASDAPELRR